MSRLHIRTTKVINHAFCRTHLHVLVTPTPDIWICMYHIPSANFPHLKLTNWLQTLATTLVRVILSGSPTTLHHPYTQLTSFTGRPGMRLILNLLPASTGSPNHTLTTTCSHRDLCPSHSAYPALLRDTPASHLAPYQSTHPATDLLYN